MSTSSILHNVIIDTPEKAEKFCKALEEAERWAMERKERVDDNETDLHSTPIRRKARKRG